MQRQGELNSRISPAEIDRYCCLETVELSFLQEACDKLNMSARAYHRVLRLARTIADMQNRNEIKQSDLAQAIQLRSLDRRS